MAHGRASWGRSLGMPAVAHALRHRERVSCCPADVAIRRAPRCHRVRLSVDRPVAASSHKPKLASVRWCQPSNVFRPRGFPPPRRFAPSTVSRACCIPLPTMRFTGLPRTGAHACSASSRSLGARPFRAFPSLHSSATRHRGCLPPCRCRHQRPDFEAFLRGGVRCAFAALPLRCTRGSPGFPCSGAVPGVDLRAGTEVPARRPPRRRDDGAAGRTSLRTILERPARVPRCRDPQPPTAT